MREVILWCISYQLDLTTVHSMVRKLKSPNICTYKKYENEAMRIFRKNKGCLQKSRKGIYISQLLHLKVMRSYRQDTEEIDRMKEQLTLRNYRRWLDAYIIRMYKNYIFSALTNVKSWPDVTTKNSFIVCSFSQKTSLIIRLHISCLYWCGKAKCTGRESSYSTEFGDAMLEEVFPIGDFVLIIILRLPKLQV